MGMTPEEFKKQMQQLQDQFGGDPESVHCQMDVLMCKLLTELKYQEGIKIFNKADKWYA